MSRTRPSATAVNASNTLALGGSFQGAIVTSVRPASSVAGPITVPGGRRRATAGRRHAGSQGLEWRRNRGAAMPAARAARPAEGHMSDDVRRQDGEAPDLSPATLAVRAGEDAARAHRGTQVPIVYSAAFGYEDVDTLGGRGARPHRGPHLLAQHQPDGRGVRGEGADPRGRRGGHELLHRHGRRQQHALRAARAGRPRRLGQGHLRRHQPDVRRLPAAHRASRWSSATPPTSSRSRRPSPGAAASSTSSRRPTRRSR